MKLILTLAALTLTSCATKPRPIIVEGQLLVVRHYTVSTTNANVVTRTTNYVVGTVRNGQVIELGLPLEADQH